MKPYTYRAAGEPDDQAWNPRCCPLCGTALTRIARTTTDRVLSLVLVAHRFRCDSFQCKW
jgi:hypothetical protein